AQTSTGRHLEAFLGFLAFSSFCSIISDFYIYATARMCTRKAYTMSCLHKERTRECCWKANFRKENPCMGALFFPRCQPRRLAKKKYGFCAKCEAHFGLSEGISSVHVERYLAYKDQIGSRKTKMSPQSIPVKAVYDAAEVRRLYQQSPMRATLSSSVMTRALSIVSQEPSMISFELAAAGALPSEYAASVHMGESEYEDREAEDEYTDSEDEIAHAESAAKYGPMVSSPVREAGTDQIIDLSDLTERVEYDGPSFVDNMSMKGRGHVGRAMLNLYIEPPIKTMTLDYCETTSNRHAVPILSPVPQRPYARSRLLVAEPSPTSPTGFHCRVRSRSHSCWIPVPPPQRLEAIWTGCSTHNLHPVMGCIECREGTFRERGIPTEEYMRDCRSAPPMLVRVHTPEARFSCAAQPCCVCAKIGREHCLTCLTRKKSSITLNANFF
ncbi:hypothetical protein BJ170DRAFT_727027, partial [Xylariales sp. AK1849]